MIASLQHPQRGGSSSAPIAPIFKADSVSLHVSREKEGKLRLVLLRLIRTLV